MMDTRALSSIDVAEAMSAGARVATATLEVRRFIAPTMRPVRGELCPQLGWMAVRPQTPTDQGGEMRFSASSTDSLGSTFFVKARHGFYAFSGTG